jgi:hypothetical protein
MMLQLATDTAAREIKLRDATPSCQVDLLGAEKTSRLFKTLICAKPMRARACMISR